MDMIIPQVVFTLFGLPITTTVVATWCAMVMIVGLILILSKWMPSALEMIVEFLVGLVSGVMDEKQAEEYLPLLGSLAIFIAISNSLGIFPLLSAPTADINTTIALSLAVFFGVHIYGIQKKGLLGYFKGLATPGIMLPFEVIGQVSRTFSLALRLFGNVISGELIAAIVFGIVPLVAPLPFVALGLFFGLLQAYIFTALSALYISLAVTTENN
jgi:F-type H+-transporting ATPase subunit a